MNHKHYMIYCLLINSLLFPDIAAAVCPGGTAVGAPTPKTPETQPSTQPTPTEETGIPVTGPVLPIPPTGPVTTVTPVGTATPSILTPITKPAEPATFTPIPSVAPVVAAKPPEVVAKVVWVKGTLKAIGPDNIERVLKPGESINVHDTIITEGKSQAQIVYSDYTTATFNEKTKMYVKQYEYKPDAPVPAANNKQSVGTFVMDLVEGSYRTLTGKIAHSNPSDYKVNTEVAVIGVRGTEYGAAFSSSSCKTYMKRFKGEPSLTNSKGTIILNEKTPFAEVSSAVTPPVAVKIQPAVFNTTLPLKPAKFTLSLSPDIKAGGGIIGGGGGICKPGSGGGAVNINIR